MKASFRKLYSQLLPILFFCLLATGLTGIILGLGDRFFQLPNLVANTLIAIHQGRFLGETIAPVYVLLMGLGVFVLGLTTLIKSKDILHSLHVQSSAINVYRVIALILIIPLALCVETGIAYRLGTDWFALSDQQTAVFLAIHGGSSWSTLSGVLYILAVGSALIALSVISWSYYKSSILPRRQRQIDLQQQPKTAYFYLSQDSLLNRVKTLKNRTKLAISLCSILFIGVIYYATSTLLFAIAIVGITFVIPALFLAKNFIQDWQHQKEIQTKLYEQEAESIIMLKAIPDSMLRMSREGICLSYMPAKEAKSFILDGDIVNKHITEFLAPEIAEEFIKSAQLSLQTGSTHFCNFPISFANGEQYHEARITPIGQTEVLIVVREIATSGYGSIVAEQLVQPEESEPVQLLTEAELIQELDTILEDIQQSHKNHILFCLALDGSKMKDNDVAFINDEFIADDLLHQIVAQIDSSVATEAIFRLDNDDLVMLVTDTTMEQASVLVNNLHHGLNEFFSTWQADECPIEFSIGLLEVNINSSDAVSLFKAVKATCEMAKQKVNLKTFW